MYLRTFIAMTTMFLLIGCGEGPTARIRGMDDATVTDADLPEGEVGGVGDVAPHELEDSSPGDDVSDVATKDSNLPDDVGMFDSGDTEQRDTEELDSQRAVDGDLSDSALQTDVGGLEDSAPGDDVSDVGLEDSDLGDDDVSDVGPEDSTHEDAAEGADADDASSEDSGLEDSSADDAAPGDVVDDTLDVGPPPPPTPTPDVLMTPQDTPLADLARLLLENDTDPSMQSLSVASFDAVSALGGALDVGDQGLTYTPPPGAWGWDSFSYTVENTSGGQAPTTARVWISAPRVALADVAAGQGGFAIQGVAVGDNSGWAVRGAGDVNGDGLEDVVVGAPGSQIGGRVSGASYVVFGRASTGAVELSALEAEQAGFMIVGLPLDRVGQAVAGVGDVNGDGLADVVVTSTSDSDGPGGSGSGTSFIVFGKQGSSPVNLAALTESAQGFRVFGASLFESAGHAVSAAGDVNGDGLADLVIGGPGTLQTGLSGGYVVFGTTTPSDVQLAQVAEGVGGFVLDSPSMGEVGWSVGGGGDVNGDGLDDIIVAGRLSGRAMVVFGKADTQAVDLDAVGAAVEGFIIEGVPEVDGHTSVAVGGDVNGDGLDDLVIGAPYVRANLGYEGEAYVVFGKPDMEAVDVSQLQHNLAGFRLSGSESRGFAGFSVAGAGDINGDGLDDLLVGAYGSAPNGSESGTTYLVFGKTDSADLPLATVAAGVGGFALDGAQRYARAGRAVSAAGDVNGDGLDDLLVGAWSEDPGGEGSGESYVVFGGNSTGHLTAYGLAERDEFIGGATAESFASGAGDDTLFSGGGPDVLLSGAGDDTIVIPGGGFARLDAGTGDDLVRLDGEGAHLDLSRVPDSAFVGVETIDLTGTGDNRLTLEHRDLFHICATSRLLLITGDAGDTVTADLRGAGFVMGITQPGFIDYSSGAFVIRIAAAVEQSGILL